MRLARSLAVLLGVVGAVWFGGMYLLMPLLMRKRLGAIELQPVAKPAEPGAPIHLTAKAHAERVAAALYSEGFISSPVLSYRSRRGDVLAFYVWFWHPVEREIAVAQFGASTIGRASEAATLGFGTVFDDGRRVRTNNSESVEPFLARVPDVHQAPMVTDPAALLRLHRAIVARGPAGTRRDIPAAGNWWETLAGTADGLARERDVAAGFTRVDAEGRYRLTTKGYYVSFWRQLWPVRPIRRWRRDRRTARLLRELGVAPDGRGGLRPV